MKRITMSEIHTYLPDDDKNHLSRLHVSASALRHNIAYFRSLLKEKTGIMVVVKASAYGNGANDVAKLVEQEALVEYLAVADVDEGVELRKAGINLPILILNPQRPAFEDLIEHCLEPEIHHMGLLIDFESYLKSAGLDSGNYPVHLKINTGMNRLGFDGTDLPKLKKLIELAQGWEVRSVLTHLSCSGDENEDDFSLEQLKKFEESLDELKPLLPETCFFHALNTDGIQRFPDHHYQMVRLGVGLYGASSLAVLRKNLKEVNRFVCRISQTRSVEANESIGYGRRGRTTKQTNIATLALGYADGFPRKLGEGNWQLEIEGKLYPTIGSICMDLCMIDLGQDWYPPQTKVTVFGGIKGIQDYAEALETISYEAMTSISARVKRVLHE